MITRNDPVLHATQDSITSSVKLLNCFTPRVGEMGGGNGSFQHHNICKLTQRLDMGKASLWWYAAVLQQASRYPSHNLKGLKGGRWLRFWGALYSCHTGIYFINANPNNSSQDLLQSIFTQLFLSSQWEVWIAKVGVTIETAAFLVGTSEKIMKGLLIVICIVSSVCPLHFKKYWFVITC